MIDYTTPIVITCINLFIVVDLYRCYIKYQKVQEFSVFNKLLFNLARLLLIANTFALITGFLDYFVFHSTVADVLQFGRFADRYVMLFAYNELTKYK